MTTSKVWCEHMDIGELNYVSTKIWKACHVCLAPRPSEEDWLSGEIKSSMDRIIKSMIKYLSQQIEQDKKKDKRQEDKPEPSLREKLSEKLHDNLYKSRWSGKILANIAADFFLENLPPHVEWQHRHRVDKEELTKTDSTNNMLIELRKAWEK